MSGAEDRLKASCTEGDNIFIHNASPSIEPFQLIDFGLSREGYIGFDQAYLELSQCIYNMRDYDPALLLSILKSLDAADDKHPLTSNARGEWLGRCLIQMRSGWNSYVTKYHSTRLDDLSRQALLARVAAGINWINKPISKNEKIIALVYAAWAARHYLESRESSLWKFATTGASEADISAKHPDPQSTDLWKLFRSEVNNFSNSEFCYVLVSGAQKYNSKLQAYGNVPWSAVIDLDPYSDQSGLLKAAEPVIRTRRGLHVLSESSGIAEFRCSTCWLLTAGWQAKGEKPLDYWKWYEHKLKIIDELFVKLKREFDSRKIILVFIPCVNHDSDQDIDKFSDISGRAFTILGSESKVILTGSSQLNKKYPNVVHIPIASSVIASAFVSSFGSMPNQSSYEIPSVHGMVSIPVQQLRMLQESLFVMHSAILHEDVAPASDQESGFWKGHPPTWHEINAGIDIHRDVTSKIIEKTKDFLNNPPSRTVFITQKPGMGGTTILRRVAWELHRNFPVVFIENDSPSLPQRLRTFYEFSGQPIIVIVEGSCLTESRFEEI